jgi:hypothetical protein
MMKNNEYDNLMPPILKSMIDGLLNKKEQINHRENRYMMLSFIHKKLGEALDEYVTEMKRK